MSAVAPAPSSPSSPFNKPRSNSVTSELSSTDDNTGNSLSAMLQQLSFSTVTITLYIQSSSVGAVIGRRGQTIAHLQKTASLSSSNAKIPVRISVREPETHTYTPLDWSDSNWTPVVIKADPRAAWSAAHQIQELVPPLQDIIVDIPLHRNKHATVVGKRGWTVATLSADHNVRIMVPSKDLRHDMIQLEGKVSATEECFRALIKVLVAPCTIVVPQLPSHTKLRQVGRKTDTIIRKKKIDENSWQLTVTGTGQTQAALALLQKWKEDIMRRSPPNSKNKERLRSGNKSRQNKKESIKKQTSPTDDGVAGGGTGASIASDS